ncbi:peptidase [Clostridia bacterium]|nr:peptidase [Clostridia bacterium]
MLTMTVSLNIYNKRIAAVKQRDDIAQKIQELDAYVRGNFIGTIDEDELLTSILDGYAAGGSSADLRIDYLTAEEYYEARQWLAGEIVTSGLQVVRDESGYMKVTGVYPGSSAAAQGIQPGDIITVVDGFSLLDIGADVAMKRISGEEGTRLSLTLLHSGEERKYTLIRSTVEIVVVTSTVVNDYGIITISGYSELTGGHLAKAIDELSAKHVKGIVFDLRSSVTASDGNISVPSRTGDILPVLAEGLNKILPPATIAVAEYLDGSTAAILETTSEQPLNLPVAVLINGGTSGISELLAAMLKDFGGAVLVGAQSRGDPVVEKLHPLKDGSAVRVPYARIASAGFSTFRDGNGLKPEYEIAAIPGNIDLQLQKALEIIEIR